MALILFGSFACPTTIWRFPKISHTVHALRTQRCLMEAIHMFLKMLAS